MPGPNVPVARQSPNTVNVYPELEVDVITPNSAQTRTFRPAYEDQTGVTTLDAIVKFVPSKALFRWSVR